MRKTDPRPPVEATFDDATWDAIEAACDRNPDCTVESGTLLAPVHLLIWFEGDHTVVLVSGEPETNSDFWAYEGRVSPEDVRAAYEIDIRRES